MLLSEITGAGAAAGVTQNLFSSPVRRENYAENSPRLTIQDALEAASKLGIDFDKVKFTAKDLLKGMIDEMEEHGNDDKQTDVIPNLKSGRDNPLYAAKIAFAHLKKDPKAYSK